MNLNGRLNKFNAYKQELQKPMKIAIGNANEQEKSNSNNFKEQQTAYKPEPDIDTSCVPKRFWRTRTPMNPECKFFFVLAKPEGSPKGTRFYFLYDDPYCSLFDFNKREIEIITTNSQLFFEGRYIVLRNNNVDRLFSLKVEEEPFHDAIENTDSDIIKQFYILSKICNGYPNTDNMTVAFYNRTINTLRFFKLVSFLPLHLFDDEKTEWYLRGCDPFLVDLFDFLCVGFIKTIDKNTQKFPTDTFIFKFIAMTFQNDDTFKSIISQVGKFKMVQEGFAFKMSTTNPYNDRTKMVLHLLYLNISKAFPNTDLPTHLVFSAIVNSVQAIWQVDPTYMHKAGDIMELDGFKRRRIPLDLWNDYIATFDKFKIQPSGYILPTHSTVTFDYFSEILKLTMDHKDKMLKIIDTYKDI
ncbi:hypothetical protein TVAG_384010 [Trichomonas vaginalis G3]|uniref:Uncharacterized protein n=1 Tax=Trichomonas vaginalis (strain ATCC PRA-98 / G3) TaxID=412133 RepID=A2F0A0_TRIV3|nr:hypothetical protein TVAGG3_0481030 [Trichomonas vaginalis G3]EAY01662.1 hypothetical protein TVAG_384010 [Trichomonas vaginalis G3]KAI5515708.1 hypothetical protein TVAGG3_0481030 [Trichomonas vaginalis G3]|eukprot:XP_001314255.1 hypothetical protein [Trichomonas vaginalis G3]